MSATDAAPAAFSYALLRVVPSAERGEQINVGVALYCRQRDYLRLRVHVDAARLAALAPELDATLLRCQLDALVRVVAGAPDAGPLAARPPSDRFGWLVAPASTVLQPSVVHTGMTSDPEAALERLFRALVV